MQRATPPYTRLMREHDLELLELPTVLARLAAAAASEPGALLAEGLRPSADADEVRLRQQQTSEAIALLDDAAEPDLGGVADVTEAAERAARGSTLDTRSLSLIERTIRAGVAGRRALTARTDLPALQELTAGIEPSSALDRRGDRTLGRGGRLRPQGLGLSGAAPPASRASRGPREAGRAAAQDRARPGSRRAPSGRLRHRARRPARPRAQGIGARPRPGDRARLVGLGADAVRRAARGGRRLEPAPRSRGRRARRGGADPPQPLLARRRPGGAADRARAGDPPSSTS